MVTQRLDIKQSQTLAMTPQLQQSIKILQLTTLELTSYINQELEQNPFLERADGSETVATGDESVDNTAPTLADGESSESVIDDGPGAGWSDDEVSPAVYESADDRLTYTHSGTGAGSDFNNSDYNLEQVTANGLTLREHILDQINVDIIDPTQRMIAIHLADSLDENGYILADTSELANTLLCSAKDIEHVVLLLQGFDPPGVFARNLAECLALQLKDKNRYDPAMQTLLEHLDLMAKGDLAKLRKLCGVSEEDLQAMCQEIRELNPRPGSDFAPESVEVIQPDVFLKRTENGWHLELNSEALPRVLINRSYYSKVESQTKDSDGKKFLSEQLNTANWLIKALDQRANTILKVATEIVSQQDEFFRNGIRYLKPMTLSDIAKVIEMHESTVSRVTNGKYMATHLGLYELKYFFSSHVASSSAEGDDISSRTVKHMIHEMIEKEDPEKILSDETIAAILRGKGVDVARRTVVKYREAMKIPSSVQRRREKKLRGA